MASKTVVVRELQKVDSKFESFVPADIITLFENLRQEHGFNDPKQYNAWMYQNRPNVPRSSITRWTRAFASGTSHSETPSWHTHYRENSSIVPERYSALKNNQFRDAREIWRKAGYIRYANVSCLHRPEGDGALISLMLDIVKDFEPNAFPYFSDTFGMNRFSQHSPNPHDFKEISVDPELSKQRENKYDEFMELIEETDEMFSDVLPDNCVKLNLWGNHENWILRYLLRKQLADGDADATNFIIRQIFDSMYRRNILWCEMDGRQFLPLTKDFWVGHGDKARNGEGTTSKAYFQQLKNSVSIAVGHSHRQEVLWTKTPYALRFAAVAGTLGPLTPTYAKQRFMSHTWGFQLITHPFEGHKGATVEDVYIHYRDGFYVTNWRGREYSQKATFIYDDLLDLV